MKMILRHRKRRNILLGIFLVVVLLVIINTTFLFVFFNKKVTPKLLEVTEKNLNKITYSIIMDYLDSDLLSQEYLNNILIITKNDNSEIITVDFNLEQSYEVLSEITKRMQQNFNELEKGNIRVSYYDSYLSNGNDGLVLSIPMGVASDYSYVSNLGPKIPVKVDFVGTVLTNIKTKITNYGLNNALVELYAYVMVTEEITTPVNFKELKTEYDVLLAAKMINGRVPSFYGDYYEAESSLFNVPLE